MAADNRPVFGQQVDHPLLRQPVHLAVKANGKPCRVVFWMEDDALVLQYVDWLVFHYAFLHLDSKSSPLLTFANMISYLQQLAWNF